jgi:hypothetical protein
MTKELIKKRLEKEGYSLTIEKRNITATKKQSKFQAPNFNELFNQIFR